MSPESEAIVNLYRGICQHLSKSTEVGVDDQRVALESVQDLSSEPTGVTYEDVYCPGTVRAAIWCRPLQANSSRVILYLHGGGGFAGSPSSYRKLAAHMAKAAGCYALVTDYRLAPTHQFPAQLDDIILTYKWLLKQGISSQGIVFAGDSAGGNFGTTVTLKLKNVGDPLPGAIVAFSPWVDMEATGESLKYNARNDVLAAPGTEAYYSQLYRGDAGAQDPLTNPLYADLSGFPPMYINAGGWETMVSDAERLAERAQNAGVDTVLDIGAEMQHTYVLMAGRAPEADKTIATIGNWLKARLQ